MYSNGVGTVSLLFSLYTELNCHTYTSNERQKEMETPDDLSMHSTTIQKKGAKNMKQINTKMLAIYTGKNDVP